MNLSSFVEKFANLKVDVLVYSIRLDEIYNMANDLNRLKNVRRIELCADEFYAN